MSQVIFTHYLLVYQTHFSLTPLMNTLKFYENDDEKPPRFPEFPEDPHHPEIPQPNDPADFPELTEEKGYSDPADFPEVNQNSGYGKQPENTQEPVEEFDVTSTTDEAPPFTWH